MDKQLLMLLGFVISVLLIYLYLEKFNPKNQIKEWSMSPTFNVSDSLENFVSADNFTIDKYGIPFEETKNICYISIYIPANTVLVIYKYLKSTPQSKILLDGELVGVADVEGKISRFETTFNKNTEKMSVFQLTTIGESYWAGHFYHEEKAYTTGGRDFLCDGIEMSNVKRNKSDADNIKSKLPPSVSETLSTNEILPGGERLGCFYDKGGCSCSGASPPAFDREYRRVLDQDQNEIEGKFKRLEECREKAHEEGHKYFALGNYGVCYSHPENSTVEVNGVSTTVNGRVTVTQYGPTNPNKCTVNSYHKLPNNLSGLTYGGGTNVLDIHNLDEKPGVRTYGGDSHDGTWVANDFIDLASAQPGLASPDQGGGTSGLLHPETQTIQVDIGAEPIDNKNKGYHVVRRWIQFTLDPEGDSMMEYCPDRKFAEFNAGACFNGSSLETCTDTKKKGYLPNKKKCMTNLKKVFIGEKDYKFKNRYFFGTVLNYLNSIQALYNTKRLTFLYDTVGQNASRDLLIYDPATASGTLKDLKEFREKLSSVTLGNTIETHINDAPLKANVNNIFYLVFNNMMLLQEIISLCGTNIRQLYNGNSDIYYISDGNPEKGIAKFNTQNIEVITPLNPDKLSSSSRDNNYNNTKIGAYLDKLISEYEIRFVDQNDPSAGGSIITNPTFYSNKIVDIIVAATSNKFITDSIEESKNIIIDKVAIFAENCNEIIHKINFIFSSCKCLPGSNSVYCTPC